MESSLLEFLDLRELGGDLQKIRLSARAGSDCCVFSATPAIKTHIAWGLDKFILYICIDRNSAYDTFKRLREYENEQVGLIVEKDDMLLFRQAHQKSDTVNRLKSLYDLKMGKLKALVVTVEAMLQFYPNPKFFDNTVIEICAETNINLEKTTQALIRCGYKREEVCEYKGDFSLNGDIINIFCPDRDFPIRISFFDDYVESIKEYDPDTMMNINTLKTIQILPLSEMDMENFDKLLNKARAEMDVSHKERGEEILSELSRGVGLEWLAPYIIQNYLGLEEYLPKETIVIFDEPKSLYEKAKLYHSDFIKRFHALLEEGEVFKSHKKLIRGVEIFATDLNFTKLAFAIVTSSNPIFRPKEIYNISTTPINHYYTNFNSLFSDIKNFNLKGYKVILCCGEERIAKNIRDSLFDENIYATYSENIQKGSNILVTPFSLSQGFIYNKEKVAIIGKEELFRKKEIKKEQKRKRNVFTMPKCGDFVVHEAHGIGLCAGIERVKSGVSEKDYIIINYAGNDKLYVPTDQMDRLQRYSGSDNAPKLSKIGGKDFQKLKERVKASVKAMAFDLLELYSKRQQSVGYKYSEDTYWQNEFEESFEFTETDDQIKAIKEIKQDMEKGIVMDRLLCGDVGYGKTEVALRAVFKTVMDGKQAAILAPTTILARQHFNTAMARFNEQKLNCVLLSRFQSKEEIEIAKEKIKTGVASVAIATHRLLSDDIIFNDLGLLVLDEEQRFGVEHKDKLKLIKNNVNVLTLSATPIPRTLNMALTGVRDISVLETPPVNRLPIQTYVSEITDSLLEESIRRELARDGQVFVLYNRVNDIEKIAFRISQLVSEAKVIVGHGQMSSNMLEDAINKFYSKEANVLVCTTIIENGIDLPDANTLIVYNADMLGLSALYQLRGRVGRSNRQAYAYFTTQSGKVITEDAMKRLTAILDFTDFGSGFKIAMRDLEIRGAGNVLGREQHGHIEKVGYDLYCKLLQEAVDELSGIGINKLSNVEMQVELDAYLDSDYITNNDAKLKIYKEIAEINTEEAKNVLIKNITDNYGTPQQSFLNLLDIAYLKNLASQVGVKKVLINSKGAGLVFDEDVYKNESVIVTAVENKDECVLSGDTHPILVFNTKNKNVYEKMKTIGKFLLKVLKKD